MFAVVTPDTIHLSPGAVVRLVGSWQDYQALNQQLGDRSSPRIKYRDGEIILMAPLPEHGRKVKTSCINIFLSHAKASQCVGRAMPDLKQLASQRRASALGGSADLKQLVSPVLKAGFPP